VKIIETNTFLKLAADWDDQQNFWKDRDQRGQGKSIFMDYAPNSEEDIKRKWTKKKKKKNKKKEEFPKPSM